MASPVASVTPTRTSGCAPLGVVFDATGTTDADTSYPFHDLLYYWNFGDSDSGTWANGTNASQPKNYATGAVAAHVYETPGTYTWTMVVWDGTNSDVETGTITVTDPNTVFSTTNTVCISTSGDFTGAPSGCTQVISSDFDTPGGTTLATYLNANKRVLFRAGETFTASTTTAISSAGAMLLGSFGTGAAPVVNATNINGVLTINNTAVNDLRVMDLEVVGNGVGSTTAFVNMSGTAPDGMTFLRVSAHDMAKGIVVQTGSSMGSSVVQECEFYNMIGSGGNGFFGYGLNSAFLGNVYGPNTAPAEHGLRLQQGVKVAITNNTFYGTPSDKHPLTIRAETYTTDADNTQYVVVSDNKLNGETSQQIMKIAPSNSTTQDERIFDVIVERNYIIFGSASSLGIDFNATRVTARNNVMDLTLAAGQSGIVAGKPTTSPVPSDSYFWFYNNTFYSNQDTSGFEAIAVGTDPGGGSNYRTVDQVVVRNNLAYAPSDTTHIGVTIGAGATNVTNSNNSNTTTSGGNGVLVDPLFVGPLTSFSGFAVGPTSYAADGGISVFAAQKSDALIGFDKSADNRIGALVQTGQAQRKGVAN